MAKRIPALCAIMTTLLVTGCAASGIQLSDFSDEQLADCRVAGVIGTDNNIDPKFLKEMAKDWSNGNKVLDCLLYPIPDPDPQASDVEKKLRYEQRLYRGHIAVALLSRYGAVNFTGDVGPVFSFDLRPYNRERQDAASLLSRIEVAENELRRSSTVGGLKKRDGKVHLLSEKVAHVEQLYRIGAVVQVAVAAERPTARRARNVVQRVIEAVATPSVSSAEALAKDALNALIKLAVVKQFGPPLHQECAGGSENDRRWQKKANIQRLEGMERAHHRGLQSNRRKGTRQSALHSFLTAQRRGGAFAHHTAPLQKTAAYHLSFGERES